MISADATAVAILFFKYTAQEAAGREKERPDDTQTGPIYFGSLVK